MYSDSHKAQRNSFAHHRAELLFSPRKTTTSDSTARVKTIFKDPINTDLTIALTERVRAGLRGFVPANATVAV